MNSAVSPQVCNLIKGQVIRIGLGQPLGLQEVEASRIFRQPANEGGKFVTPTHRPFLTLWRYSWYSFLLEIE
jgi:hypothetical protein